MSSPPSPLSRWSYVPDVDYQTLRSGHLKGPSGFDLLVVNRLKRTFDPSSGYFLMVFDPHTETSIEMKPVTVLEGGEQIRKVRVETGPDLVTSYFLDYDPSYDTTLSEMIGHLKS